LRDLDFAACFHFQVPFKHPHSRNLVDPSVADRD
jgi:hypothetical protein